MNKNNDDIDENLKQKYEKEFKMKIKDLKLYFDTKLKASEEELEKLKKEKQKEKQKDLEIKKDINQSSISDFSLFSESNLPEEKQNQPKKPQMNRIEDDDDEDKFEENLKISSILKVRDDESFSSLNIIPDKASSLKKSKTSQKFSRPAQSNSSNQLKQNLDSSDDDLSASQRLNNSESNQSSKNNSLYLSQKIKFEKKYHYKCITNFVGLVSYIHEGTESTTIDLIIKNDGNIDWPESAAKLKFEPKSQITGEDVNLQPQNCLEEKNYTIKFNNLKNLKVGEYNSYMSFYINDEKVGEELNLRINIKPKINPLEEEINKHMDEIQELRETFSLSEEDYTNEMIYDSLKKNDFNIEETFSNLFN